MVDTKAPEGHTSTIRNTVVSSFVTPAAGWRSTGYHRRLADFVPEDSIVRFAINSPIDQVVSVSTTERSLRTLEDCGFESTAARLRELAESDEAQPKMDEGSVVEFADTLVRARWPAPTNLGLTTKGRISATWANPPLTMPDGKSRGEAAVVVVPAPDGVYEITAMFGVPSDETPWMEMVGNAPKKDAMGLIDMILRTFHECPGK